MEIFKLCIVCGLALVGAVCALYFTAKHFLLGQKDLPEFESRHIENMYLESKIEK